MITLKQKKVITKERTEISQFTRTDQWSPGSREMGKRQLPFHVKTPQANDERQCNIGRPYRTSARHSAEISMRNTQISTQALVLYYISYGKATKSMRQCSTGRPRRTSAKNTPLKKHLRGFSFVNLCPYDCGL